jgi:hypothetical protein
MKELSYLLIAVMITVGTIPAFAVSAIDDAVEVAKRQCHYQMPPDGTIVDWGAIPSGQKMWSKWDGYGPGWEVHGVYSEHTEPGDITQVDMIVFVPVRGRPSGCASVET